MKINTPNKGVNEQMAGVGGVLFGNALNANVLNIKIKNNYSQSNPNAII